MKLKVPIAVGAFGWAIINNDYLLGVYAGGPPFPGQREVTQAAELLEQNKSVKLQKLLKHALNMIDSLL